MKQLNAATWLDPGMVACYAGDTGLQGAEARILSELRPRMGAWSMLDVGVGGGRTTRHFAPAVADYVGVDISPSMVEHCRREFGSGHCRFEVTDVRELSALGKRRFDLVLFSYNGLDYLTHEDRLRALEQIHEACRPGGYFCFSTHNIEALPHLMRLRAQYTRDPEWLWRNLGNWFRWRLRHARHVARVAAQRREWAIVNDGAHECRLETYYVRPAAQLAQLEPAFGGTRVFSVDGQELAREDLESTDGDWLYFLCQAR
ncbi:class I SAM-dependent methyltransferase [Ramlibacter henchirensis]|uniref:Class I SAM-dependent methyltransferase n=1 Tax=Ramlibacter henchirensis TaxID=204072 RepID=A0A4Z0C7F5_9BURK|nr:class I SAM-dependent methyltransferase [Ramlibacter henchirensis]TFZ06029.1 class I SAM-dependent methyltransferase [Ramlibacter henchirensis]